ncbi:MULTISPECIES: MMPL family transporter [Methylocaldum]|jgi:hopanoid biosynthesis associated RND transporter like protein HpnN|uniref:MMPL family transporter n=1 Tax=unclassified Methylocaldum TaxID=2622260 RepID=UPI00098BBF49|nr:MULTISPECIES: MMPL family transporter [unclassified Methylocaldum]MBP1149615.1 hopanoid biosynthesis associated RND transporter like protein HpnN [Methylocaldum sp. RMAD-M]
MSRTAENLFIRVVHWWEENFLNRPWLVTLLFLIASGFTLQYTMENLKFDTNTADMISTELPFQKNRIKLEKAFPQDVSTIILLVEGKTPEETADAVKLIGEKLRQNRTEIKSVHIPDEGEFFARNGLLYLDLEELEDLSAQLANAQPFIGRISENNSLGGLLDILGEALKASEEGFEIELNPLLEKIREAVVATSEGKPYRLSWQQLMLTRDEGLGVTKRFINITPVLNFEELLPAEKAIGAIDKVLAEVLQGDLADVSVRKTGEVVLEHEEMQTVGTGVSIASVASLILVSATLWVAYRSFKLMFATFVALTMGLIFSLGFATVAIGQLNLISIGFAVLFIGMGDAYSSHFCLRYRELVLRGVSQREALRETLTSTGSSLVLCSITAATGLYAFIPTNYSGVAELGIIAGTSMFIALATTFTILPALLKIMPLRPPRRRKEKKGASFLSSNWPIRYAPSIRTATVVLGLISVGLLCDVTVDFNPINLRDPNTESVKTFKYLLQFEDTSPMTLASLARSEAEVKAKKAAFESLPTVDKVVSIFDFIPENQDDKLAIISDLSLIMGPQLESFPPSTREKVDPQVIENFHQVLRDRAAAGENGVIKALDEALTQLHARLETADESTRQAMLGRLQDSILGPLPATIANLRESLQAHPISMGTLPPDLKNRWVSADGLYRLQIFPNKDLNDLENLREFILEAQKVDKNVTDVPVAYLESMNEAINAFQQAFGIAFVATTILLLLIVRNLKDTLLVLLPLLLASLFTAASTVLFDIPFNFANIIALPLLFGLGVDNGIHMAHRLHYLHSNDENLLSTSEAQGIFYGSLTTVFSFGSLAFTAHQGTASMGMILTIGLMLTLICALVVLPAFSTLRVSHRR